MHPLSWLWKWMAGCAIPGGCVACALVLCLCMGGCEFGKDHPDYDQRMERLDRASQELPSEPATAPAPH